MSEKRTDLGDGAEGPLERSDFLRKEEEDVTRGRSAARAKSGEREGSLGWVMVEESVGTPRNWEARSLYCFWRFTSVAWRVLDALGLRQ